MSRKTCGVIYEGLLNIIYIEALIFHFMKKHTIQLLFCLLYVIFLQETLIVDLYLFYPGI